MKKLLEIRLFGPCIIRGTGESPFELTGTKHRGFIALLATSPTGRLSRAHLQNMLWGTTCFDNGRQSLRRAISDIKARMGAQFNQLLTFSNSNVTLDLAAVRVVGSPRAGEFLQGLDIREAGFARWLAEMRQTPGALEALVASMPGPEQRRRPEAGATLPVEPWQTGAERKAGARQEA